MVASRTGLAPAAARAAIAIAIAMFIAAAAALGGRLRDEPYA